MSMIYTVRDNLINTIKGKEAYLAQIQKRRIKAVMGDDVALAATEEFLKININELKVILFDIEKACEEHNLAMWEINPERMGQ